jgi:hypothetical protein
MYLAMEFTYPDGDLVASMVEQKTSNSLGVRTKLATSFKNFPSLLGLGVNHMLI